MKITVGQAIMRILSAWDIDHIYGIPGSSLNGIFDALDKEQDKIKYVQVRHEQGGALAASAHYKLTKKIGAAFGSGGPGGTNLINGLYDAKMERVPMLAIWGMTSSENVNTTFFQEMSQLPVFADATVYNKQAINAQQIPDLIEEAIRTAYSKKGPAVVILPTDMVETEIEYSPRKEKRYIPQMQKPIISKQDMDLAVKMIKESKKPVLYLGQGVYNAKDLVSEVSNKF